MHRSFPLLAFLALFGSVALAGCGQSPNALASPWTPQAFSASYTVSSPHGNGRVSVEFGPVETIKDRDSISRPAYRVELDTYLDSQSSPPVNQAVIWLDGNLRVARHEDPCIEAGRRPPCRHIALNWETQGALAPLGLGYLGAVLPNGTMAEQIGGVNVWIQPAVTKDRDTIQLSFPEGAAVVTKAYLNLRGASLSYASDSPLPHRITGPLLLGWQDGTATLSSFTPKGPLLKIPPWPMVPFAPTAFGKKELMGPGESDPWMGSDITPMQALTELRAKDAEADGILKNGGCIASFSVSDRTNSTTLPQVPSLPLTNKISQVGIDIINSDGNGFSWKVDYTKNLTGGSFTVEPKQTFKGYTTCAAIKGMPAIDLPPLVAFQRLQNFPLGCGSPLGFSWVFWDRKLDPTNEYAAGLGVGAYEFACIPAYVGTTSGTSVTLTYHVEISMSNGWTRIALMDPEKLSVLDNSP